jgi:hypothetical protein
MLPPIIPDDGRLGFMDMMVAEIGNAGNNSRVHLFTNRVVPTRRTVLADLVEIFFVGYFPPALPAAVIVPPDDTGKVVLLFGKVNFQQTAPGTAVVAYGFWVDSYDSLKPGKRLLWLQRFPVATAFARIGDRLTFELSLGGGQC